MELQLSAERQAELVQYAQRRGQDPMMALDEVLAAALEWERQDYHNAVQGIRGGYSDWQAGNTQPLEDSFEKLRAKHNLPR